MSNSKNQIITFDEQLERLLADHDVPKADAINVFDKFRTVQTDILAELADKEVEQYELQTPFGAFGFAVASAETRVDSASGEEYEAPKRWIGNFSFAKWMIDTANKNVDLQTLPSSAEFAITKAA